MRLVEQQRVTDLFGNVTGFALATDHPALMLGFPVMTAEAIAEGPRPQIRPLGMIRIPGLAVGRNMAARNHDRITFDRGLVHNGGMARRAALPLSSHPEGLHVRAMAHHQPDVLDRRREIARGDFGDAQNIPVAAQTHLGIDFGLKVVRIRRRSEQVNRDVFRPVHRLVVDPAFDPRPHVAGDAGHFFVRGLGPTLVGRRDGMTTGTELRVIRKGNGHAPERDRSRRENEDDCEPRRPAHALIEHVEGNAA